MPELLVTYPGGSTEETTTVLALTHADGETWFAVQRTPCHPESPRWPDQPGDKCAVEIDGASTAIECAEGFLTSEGVLGLGPPADDAEAQRCVVHRGPADLAIEVGTEVTLHVDEAYREALSTSHSRCHLVSLALNAALAEAWRKNPGSHDSLGHPDFDKLAIQSSRITTEGSVDVYRIGKHVRKSGFSVDALADEEALATRVREIALGWIASRPAMSVTPGESTLDERRTWSCPLPEAVASFPCGGTHVSSLEPDSPLTLEITWEPQDKRLTMTASA